MKTISSMKRVDTSRVGTADTLVRRRRRTRSRPTLRRSALAVTAALGATLSAGLYSAAASAQDSVGLFDIADVLAEDDPGASVEARDVALDSEGNRYVLGSFTGTVRFGDGRSAQELSGTDGDLFVARYDADDDLQWVQQFDSVAVFGLPNTDPAGIVFDDTFGNVIVAGTFTGRLVIGSNQLEGDLSSDGFVAQLDPESGAVKWANHIDGSKSIEVADIATNGNIAVTGAFDGIAEFGGQSGSSESKLTLSPGGSDMYTAVYAFDGSLDFVLQAGGEDAEGASVDFGPGTLVVGGDFVDTVRFPDRTGQAVESLTSAGSVDGFVVSYTVSGRRKFARRFGGGASDAVRQIAAKGFHIYAAGNFREQMDVGQERFTSLGASDGFVAQINGFDGSVQVARQIGGIDGDFVHSIDADGLNGTRGALFVAGEFDSPSLEIGQGSSPLVIGNPNGAGERGTTYVVGFDVAGTVMEPVFGQAVAGDFFSRGLGVNEAGTELFLPGRRGGATTFGEGDGRLELSEPLGERAMAVARFAPVDDDENTADALLISSTSGGRVGDVDFRDEDVLVFSAERQRFAMFIDGSDIGLGAVDIDAVQARADGTVLLSIDRDITLPDLGEVTDRDVLRFTPEQLGTDTRGTLEIFLRGDDLGLDARSEDIDVLTSDEAGRLVISTKGAARVPAAAGGTLRARDEDLLALDGDTWELHVDGSAIGLELASEDIRAARLDAGGLSFSTVGDHDIGGLVGSSDDVVACAVIGGGADTEVRDCRVLFDGDAHGFGDERIDAFSVGL